LTILELFASFRAITYVFDINKVSICQKFEQKAIFETLAILTNNEKI
jgi:hypothetical protein